MTIDKIQVLIEVDEGEYHANQCTRHLHSQEKHERMRRAFDQLQKEGFISVIGDEFVLSGDGDDVLLIIRRASIDLLTPSR